MVVSSAAKFNPVIVTEVPADGGPLNAASIVRTGASKENTAESVPTIVLRVTPTLSAEPYPSARLQDKEVMEFQEVVSQTLLPNLADGVSSSMPKFRPHTVTLAPTETGAFVWKVYVTTGALYVKMLYTVPN